MTEKRKQRMKTRNVILLLLLIAAAYACFLPLPRSIHVTHCAVAWRNCDDANTPTSVTMDGIYFDYLFREDYFDGAITVSGFPETFKPLPRVTFHDGMGMLFYQGEQGLLEPMFGWIIPSPEGSAFTIGVHNEHGWSADTGLNITGPADNRYEAVQLANKLCQRYHPSFLGTWTFE